MTVHWIAPLLILMLCHQQAFAQAGPCEPNPCTFPPPNQCVDSTTLLYFDPVGICTDLGGGQPSCQYSGLGMIDCSASGMVCESGQCLNTTAVPSMSGRGLAMLAGLLVATAVYAWSRRRPLKSRA